jgi:hypothetical protein
MESGKVVNYLKECIMDCSIYTEDEESFAAIYDEIIHSNMALKLKVKELKKLYLTYLTLNNLLYENRNKVVH